MDDFDFNLSIALQSIGVITAAIAAAVAAASIWFQERRARRERAVSLTAEAIRELTTGRIVTARGAIADFTTRRLEGSELNEMVFLFDKHQESAFAILWSIERLAALTDVVDDAFASQRTCLSTQINSLETTLHDFVDALTESEHVLFAAELQAACVSARDLKKKLQTG